MSYSELLQGDVGDLEQEDIHQKCQEDYQQLKEEFERYKLRAQSVLKNKTTKVCMSGVVPLLNECKLSRFCFCSCGNHIISVYRGPFPGGHGKEATLLNVAKNLCYSSPKSVSNRNSMPWLLATDP